MQPKRNAEPPISLATDWFSAMTTASAGASFSINSLSFD